MTPVETGRFPPSTPDRGLSKAPVISSEHLEAQVPDLAFYLHRTGERVIHVSHIPVVIPTQPLSLTDTILTLTRVDDKKDIGRNGIVNTALAVGEQRNYHDLLLFENAEFGRDALLFAKKLLPQHPRLMRTTLVRLAELQGTRFDPLRDEEPGEIFHEYRGPNTPVFGSPSPYYGASDTTISYINGIIAYIRQEGRDILHDAFIGRDGRMRTMEDSLFDAAGWLTRRMNRNPQGLIEFQKTTADGIDNQVWKDSADSYFHKDGALANHDGGVSSIELQVDAYNALMGFIDLYPEHNNAFTRNRLQQIAQNVEDLWIEDERGGFFALGTDRDAEGRVQRLDILTSNTGYVLKSPLLHNDTNPNVVSKREALIQTLFGPSLFSVAGIRTLAVEELRYTPDAYHNGKVWPQDVSEIAEGLDTHGYYGLANELRRRIVADMDESRLFPENFRGNHDARPTISNRIVDVVTPEGKEKRLEQPPQPILAMAVGAAFEATESLRQVEEGSKPAFAEDPAKRKFEEKILASLPA